MLVEAIALQIWCTQLLQRWGYSETDAAYIADTLVDADARGIGSHGVIRLPAYWRRVEASLIDPQARTALTQDKATMQIDAASVAGQLAARAGVAALETAAREYGIASVTIRNSSHFGAAGYYTRALARRGFIAMATSNAEPTVVPFGGKQAVLGTNPFAFAAPAEPHPLSIDMATSTTAMGRVLLAAASGTPIPPDWGIDEQGHPTTDPEKVVALQPFAGPKGYGMGMLVETMSGVLSGSAITSDIGNMYTDFSKPQRSGHWLMALDVSRHLLLADFVTRMAVLIERCHETPPSAGFDEVLTPGEPEERTRELRLRDGIPLAPATVGELSELGAAAQIQFPTPL